VDVVKTVDAMDLEPGDQIVVPGGRIERVRAASTREPFNTVEIHTDSSDILAGHPCPVRVVMS
jgi:hypothetical protein